MKHLIILAAIAISLVSCGGSSTETPVTDTVTTNVDTTPAVIVVKDTVVKVDSTVKK